MTAVHPKCGKPVPGGNSGGHCAGCCQSFRGATAFEKHLIRTGGRPIHQDPAEAVTPKGKPLDYWMDGQGVWHLGPRDPRFTKEES